MSNKPCLSCAHVNLRKVTRQQAGLSHVHCDFKGHIVVLWLGVSECAAHLPVADDVVEKRNNYINSLRK